MHIHRKVDIIADVKDGCFFAPVVKCLNHLLGAASICHGNKRPSSFKRQGEWRIAGGVSWEREGRARVLG